MSVTYNAIGSPNADGTLQQYGNTAAKQGDINDALVVGQKYKLASGAHTGGTALCEATCLAVDTVNNKALMQSNGLYGAAWPGSGELDCSTYFSGMNVAISDVYLPRAQGGITGPTTTTPTGVSVYWNSAWSDEFSATIKSLLANAASRYASYSANIARCFLGTAYNNASSWVVIPPDSYDFGGNDAISVIAPTFTLDIDRVTVVGDIISLTINRDTIHAYDVLYGEGTVEDELDELNSKYTSLSNRITMRYVMFSSNEKLTTTLSSAIGAGSVFLITPTNGSKPQDYPQGAGNGWGTYFGMLWSSSSGIIFYCSTSNSVYAIYDSTWIKLN